MCQAVWVVAVRDELEEIHDVDETDFQIWEVLAEQCGGGERFLRHDVSGGSDDEVWGGGVGDVGGPGPDADAFCAVHDRVGHGEVLQVGLLVGDDDVDIVFGLEAVRHCGEEGVGVRGQVDAHDFGGFVDDYVEETGVLGGSQFDQVVMMGENAEGPGGWTYLGA